MLQHFYGIFENSSLQIFTFLLFNSKVEFFWVLNKTKVRKEYGQANRIKSSHQQFSPILKP